MKNVHRILLVLEGKLSPLGAEIHNIMSYANIDTFAHAFDQCVFCVADSQDCCDIDAHIEGSKIKGFVDCERINKVPYQITRESLPSICRFVKIRLSVEEGTAVIIDAAGSRLI